MSLQVQLCGLQILLLEQVTTGYIGHVRAKPLLWAAGQEAVIGSTNHPNKSFSIQVSFIQISPCEGAQWR